MRNPPCPKIDLADSSYTSFVSFPRDTSLRSSKENAQMANDSYKGDDGWPPFTSSRKCQQIEKSFDAHQGWWNLEEAVDDGIYASRLGVKFRKAFAGLRYERSPAPSTSTAVSRRTSVSDMEISEHLTTGPVEDIPTPVRSNSKTATPRLQTSSSISSLRVEEDVRGRMPPHEYLELGYLAHPTNQDAGANALSAPPSPRNEILNFRHHNDRISISELSAPLDRFLAQQGNASGHDQELEWSEEEWRRLQSSRANGQRLRYQLERKAEELSKRDLNKSLADDAFMQFVQDKFRENSVPSSQSDISLFNLLKAKLQETRDEYGPIEFEYRQLEKSLSGLDFEIARLESRLYRTKWRDLPTISVPKPQQAAPPPPLAPLLRSPPSNSLLELGSDDNRKKYHPLQARYLDRLGDLDIVRERLYNYRQRHERTLDDKEARDEDRMELKETDVSFLAEFPDNERKMELQIAEIEDDVAILREACVAEGLSMSESSEDGYSEDGYSEDGYSEGEGESEDFQADDSVILSLTKRGSEATRCPSPESSHEMFPILLPEAKDRDTAELDHLISEFDEKSKNDRIRKWMQHKLRTSPLELELLVRVSVEALKSLELRKWKTGIVDWEFCVLLYWEKDEAKRSEGQEPDILQQDRNMTTLRERDLQRLEFFKESLMKHSSPMLSRRSGSAPPQIHLDDKINIADMKDFVDNIK